ncbi:oligoendopeptidase F [Staphylococcus sp. EG-SA-6]|jgi:oligoendopeptidase F|uniref:Oligopeptidase F n=3 Tax=Staphylococcus TaxID=1279 RepID=A0A2A1K4B1_STAHA|nr:MULTISPECIES: oligoendopeptidase F [Staphylococcus]KDP50934.1 oligoendopeptidase F [Staphylococcus aureus subsp. aureus CO-98]MBN4935118.1 oligoendopeptidase F [Staphylococcus sp. EG-SA-6]AMW23001.1 oligopeptidase PepB [Staphylococcus haemolyticus]AUV67935.1 oligoendopeptidase F [Staphylococcus haemolyticus]AUV70313.1 oligoendopeptidase F [Staphylococcus haemolyticus]
MSQQLTREEQERKYPNDTWDLTTIFKNDEAFEEALKEVEGYLGKEEQFKGHLADSADTLCDALALEDEIGTKLEKVYVYAHLKQDQDTSNDKYTGFESRAHQLIIKISSAWSFLVPEILQIDEDKLQSFIETNDNLKRYEFDLKLINEKRPHILDAEQERLLTEAQDALSTPSNVYGMFSNADLEFEDAVDKDGEKHPLTQGTFIKYLESDDRELRQSAYNNLYKAYGAYNNTLGSTLAGEVKKNVFNARTHNYKTARERALSNNHIPEEVYDNLVKTVHKYLPLLHRYTKLRKELLAVDELKMYDLYTPMVKDVKFEMPYEEAKEWMLKALEPMGEEYLDVVKEGLNNRWVDVYENKGKRSGGYSSGAHLTNPFILLNWSDTVSDLYTLIHEFGHSAHSYFSRKHQPSNSSDYSIFVAEVASTCNEALLSDYMDKHLDDERRLLLLNQELERFRATLFRQTMFAEFEHKIHQIEEAGEPLTATRMNDEYAKLNKQYFGDVVETDDNISKEWSRIPHFYMNYYVYQYATGYSAAQSLSHQILTEGKPAVERYINEFLKKGSSNYPIEILKNAGVDMTSPEPIEQACEVFEQKLDTFEKLMKA